MRTQIERRVRTIVRYCMLRARAAAGHMREDVKALLPSFSLLWTDLLYRVLPCVYPHTSYVRIYVV